MISDLRHAGLLRAAALATLTATAGVAVVHVIADASGDALLVAPEFGSGQPKRLEIWIAMLATATLGGGIGTLLATALRRFAARPRLAFVAVCLTGLIAYGILAFVRADATSTGVWLNIMHLAAAVPIVGALTAALPSETRVHVSTASPQAR